MSRRGVAPEARGDLAWYEADEGSAHKILIPYVQQVERRQSDAFDRFVLLDALYDPNGYAAQQQDQDYRDALERITENVIASNVDTVRSAVAPTEVRPRFLTDGASWSAARRAAEMETYAEEVGKRVKLAEAAVVAFFDTALKGTGVLKFYADESKTLHVDAVMPDNIVVDDAECRNGGAPRQMHQRQLDFDRDVLVQQFPEYRAKIYKAKGASAWRQMTARTMGPPFNRNDVAVVESWRLPLGNPDDEDTYIPGRHVIAIDGCDLLDDEWHDPFPFAVMRWGLRRQSWYGISLAERIIGHQRTLNKRGWHEERMLDSLAVPTAYVSMADQHLRVLTTEAGNIVPLRGNPPVWQTPSVLSPELAASKAYAKAGAFEETGVSRMAATSTKPTGLDSGVALREWRDMGTDRFSMQEKAYERLNLDATLGLLRVCKDLGPDAPMISRKSRWAPRRIGWADVDLGDLEVQIGASSTLPRTAAGREQTVMEFVQAGLFNLDEARELLDRPDVEHMISLYTSQRQVIAMQLEGIERGHQVLPEPFDNLTLATSLSLARYHELEQYHDVPEDVLEGVRTYHVQAQNLANPAPMPGAAPMGPAGVPALGPPLAMPPEAMPQGPPLVPPPMPQMAAQ